MVSVEEANARALKAMSETAWRNAVVAHAQQRGWMVFFVPDKFHAAAKQGGYLHLTRMGDKGFPDLHLVSPEGRVVYAELKTEVGVLKPDQKTWRDRLLAGGHDWRLWRPRDLDADVIPTLEGRLP